MSWNRPPGAQRWQLEFGEHLRRIRRSQGHSQLTLANLADLDPTYISAVEQGRRNITLVNIRRLALALQVSPRDFFDEGSSALREKNS